MKKILVLALLFCQQLLAQDFQYEEQKLSLYDTKNKLISESVNYRIITTDQKLKRISVESTEVTLDQKFKNKNLYRIYKGPKGHWVLEDTISLNTKLVMTLRHPDNSDWPIRSYTAVGPMPDGGKQMISFEQTLSQSKGRIDYTDWKGNPKGYLMIEGKAIQEAQYLSRLKDVKH